MAFGLRPLAQDRGGQLGALHLGEVHPALFEDPTALDHAGAAATALGADPAFFFKTGATVELLEAGADGVLQAHHQGAGPLSGVRGGRLKCDGAGGRRGLTRQLGLGTGQQTLQHRCSRREAWGIGLPFQSDPPLHKFSRGFVIPPRDRPGDACAGQRF